MAMGDQVAVFNAGRIVQVGAPYEVYSAPKTRFVADFIGEANVLDATVTGATIRIEGFGDLPTKTLVAPVSGNGEDIFVAIRPESVAVDKDQAGSGVVTEVTFVGGDLHLEVQVGPVRITARQPSSSLAAGSSLSRGDTVSVSFHPQSVRVVTD